MTFFRIYRLTPFPLSPPRNPLPIRYRNNIITHQIVTLLLITVGFPILFFFIWGDPYKRGFFCNDESLRHPFHESTIRNWMLYIIGLILPIIVVSWNGICGVRCIAYLVCISVRLSSSSSTVKG